MNDGATLAEIGEFALLAELLPGLRQGAAVRLGPGDDAAVVAIQGDLAISTDTLVEGVHFRREWSDAEQVGRKSVAVNVADIEAMGIRPVGVVMALSAPGTLPAAWVRDFFRGVTTECERAGVSLVGGDITGSRDVTIGVSVFGDTEGEAVVRRSGAQPGDVVAYVGDLGLAAAGLSALSRGFRSPRAAVERQRCPEVPYGQGVVARKAGAHAMIDVSDGLVADLGHIAEASGVTIDLRRSAFELPDAVRAVAAATGADPLTFVIGGGEDHALAAVFAPGGLPEGWRAVGVVNPSDGEHSVALDGQAWENPAGWDHYRR